MSQCLGGGRTVLDGGALLAATLLGRRRTVTVDAVQALLVYGGFVLRYCGYLCGTVVTVTVGGRGGALGGAPPLPPLYTV